jgi:hypothetical protein
MWAVLYDDGMSLTTASERIARSLAEAERQRGRSVTVRRLDNVETHPRGTEKPARPPGRGPGDGPVRPRGAGGVPEPEPEPIRPAGRFARLRPVSEPEPVPAPDLTQVSGPTQAAMPAQAEPASVSEPAGEASPPEVTGAPAPGRATTSARRRRLLVHALAAASIVVAAALADHWDVLPRVSATTSSSPTQVSGPPHRPQLLPPLNQPPVMHFSNAVNARPTPAEPSSGPSAFARGG